jgi:ribosome-binding protein aMBF1 (putative translation factor)
MLFDDLASGCSSRTQWGLGFGLDRPPASEPESRPPAIPGRAKKSRRPGGQQERGVALPGLVTARHALGLSQVELAERAGLGVATISRLERGGRAHSTTIDLLVTALGVTRARLLRAPRKRTARLPTPGDPAS